MISIKSFFSYISIALLLIACNGKDSYSGDSFITGRAYLYNEYEMFQDTIELTGAKIYLAEVGGDKDNYLYSAETNDKGYFQFTHLEDQKEYTLFGEFIKDDIKYNFYDLFISSKESSITNPHKILFNIDKSQPGLFIKTTDINGDRLAKCNLCFYTSLIGIDSLDLCDNAVLISSSNNNGDFFTNQLLPGNYYLKGTFKIADGSILVDTFSITLPTTNITTTNIQIID